MIEAMKLALGALEDWDSWSDHTPPKTQQALVGLRQAIEQAEQAQPVALSDEWTPCVKLPIVVHVRKQRMNEKHVSTREGITPVKSDDLIMRGVAGEEYPIGRDLFERTYTLDTTPQRKPLTDEEIDELWDGHTVPVFGKTGINPIVFARAVEAAHGIKE